MKWLQVLGKGDGDGSAEAGYEAEEEFMVVELLDQRSSCSRKNAFQTCRREATRCTLLPGQSFVFDDQIFLARPSPPKISKDPQKASPLSLRW